MTYYEKAREFRNDYEYYSYQSLIDVRDQLLKDILRYEQGDPDFIPIEEDIPDPGEQYLTDLLYATNVFTMLFHAFKEEYEKQLKGTTP